MMTQKFTAEDVAKWQKAVREGIDSHGFKLRFNVPIHRAVVTAERMGLVLPKIEPDRLYGIGKAPPVDDPLFRYDVRGKKTGLFARRR